jgi:hypothetical protein
VLVGSDPERLALLGRGLRRHGPSIVAPPAPFKSPTSASPCERW